MKKTVLAALLLITPLSLAELPQQELKEILAPHIADLLRLSKNRMLLEAVRNQNQQDMKLSDIQKIDQQWIAGTSPQIQKLQENKPGSFLKSIVMQQSDLYSEALLTDAKGANVAAYPATSDYWQGDEDKFTKSFANGRGEIYIGDIEADASSHTTAVQISVPMMDQERAIGVLVIGVKVSALIAEKLDN